MLNPFFDKWISQSFRYGSPILPILNETLYFLSKCQEIILGSILKSEAIYLKYSYFKFNSKTHHDTTKNKAQTIINKTKNHPIMLFIYNHFRKILRDVRSDSSVDIYFQNK